LTAPWVVSRGQIEMSHKNSQKSPCGRAYSNESRPSEPSSILSPFLSRPLSGYAAVGGVDGHRAILGHRAFSCPGLITVSSDECIDGTPVGRQKQKSRIPHDLRRTITRCCLILPQVHKCLISEVPVPGNFGPCLGGA
jgi:hypothetical protein